MLLVPLILGDETIGLLSLGSRMPDAYAGRHVKVAGRIGAQIAGAVANAQVYLECKQVEESVREAVGRLDLAIQGSGDGLWDWKIIENEVWWSSRFKELVGCRHAEEDGGYRGWEARLHPDDRELVLQAISDHLMRKIPYDVEYRIRTSSGEYRWFSDRGQAIWDESGRAIRMSGSLRDIGGPEPDKERLPGYTEPLDLRVPLATITGFKQAMLASRASERDADGSVFVTRLQAASQRMALLTGDLQTLSWAMDSEVRREPVDLSAMARSIIRKLRQARGKRKITFSIDKGLVVEGDARLLGVMMENLLDNAWKYTGKRVSARVEVGVTQQDGQKVYYVRDDGVGFDIAHAGRLFRLFQRLHSQAEFEGTGLGLVTVRHIVRRHGGSVWAEGQVDRGATFFFTL